MRSTSLRYFLLSQKVLFKVCQYHLTHHIYMHISQEIFEEPKESSELHDLQEKYTKKIKNSSGACLIGVTSGKVCNQSSQ